MISDMLLPELRCLASRKDRAAVLSAALNHPVSLLRFTPIELLSVALLVFGIWLVAWIPAAPLPNKARTLIYLAGYLPVVAVVIAAMVRNLRNRIITVMFANGTELCAFCRYPLGDESRLECPECGKPRQQSHIIHELRLSDVEPIFPDLYERCESAKFADQILRRAKASMDSLWAARGFLAIASGVGTIVVAVIVAQVVGFFARGGSPEKWIVIPGVVLGFVLPVVVHTSILRMLRNRFRERLDFERTRAKRVRQVAEVGGLTAADS